MGLRQSPTRRRGLISGSSPLCIVMTIPRQNGAPLPGGLWMEPVLIVPHTSLSDQPLAPLRASFVALSTHLPSYTFVSVPL